MGEWIKIALKAGLVVVMLAVVWSALTYLPSLPGIPATFWTYIGKVKAVGEYYLPGFNVFLAFCLGAIAVRLAGLLARFTLNLTKWLYQIFE